MPRSDVGIWLAPLVLVLDDYHVIEAAEEYGWILFSSPAPLSADTSTAQFRPATTGYQFQFPRDHGSHPAFRTEWWYITGWLQTSAQRPLGFQLTFFRSRTGIDDDNPSRFALRQVLFAHLAISDLRVFGNADGAAPARPAGPRRVAWRVACPPDGVTSGAMGAMLTHAAGCVFHTNASSAWVSMRWLRHSRMPTRACNRCGRDSKPILLAATVA